MASINKMRTNTEEEEKEEANHQLPVSRPSGQVQFGPGEKMSHQGVISQNSCNTRRCEMFYFLLLLPGAGGA